MLNAKEIATVCGICSETGQPHARLVTSLMEDFKEEKAAYYYETRHGLMKVYPQTEWVPILQSFLRTYRDRFTYISTTNKRYQFKTKEGSLLL